MTTDTPEVNKKDFALEFPYFWVKLSPMQLGCRKMGCGRSKHEQSQKNSSQEEINMPQKTGRKKKLKGDKKENKDPKKDHLQQTDKHHPVHHQNLHHNSHVSKPPVLSVNGSHSQELHIDIDLPAHKEKENRFLMPTKDGKEFQTGKHIKVTHSQIEFFKMLDEKIEQGECYESEDRETDTSSPCE